MIMLTEKEYLIPLVMINISINQFLLSIIHPKTIFNHLLAMVLHSHQDNLHLFLLDLASNLLPIIQVISQISCKDCHSISHQLEIIIQDFSLQINSNLLLEHQITIISNMIQLCNLKMKHQIQTLMIFNQSLTTLKNFDQPK